MIKIRILFAMIFFLICFRFDQQLVIAANVFTKNEKENKWETDIIFSAGNITIYGPIEVLEALAYGGGTITLALRDKRGRTYTFCLWHELGAPQSDFSVYEKISERNHSATQQIPFCGREQKLFVDLLEGWLTENITEEERRLLFDVGVRRHSPKQMDREEWTGILRKDDNYKKLRVLQLIQGLKDQCAR